MIFEDKDYVRAQRELEVLIARYPTEESGRTLRYILLQRSGRDEEALQVLKADYNELPTSMLQYFLIKVLTDGGRWGELYAMAASDYKRTDITSSMRFEAFLAAFHSGMMLGEIPESEKLLTDFVVHSEDATELMRTQYLLSLKKGIEPTALIKAKIVEAAKRSLEINPVNYYVLKGLLTDQRDYIAPNALYKIVKHTYSHLDEAQKQESYGRIVFEMAGLLKKSKFPTDDEFKVWDKMMK